VIHWGSFLFPAALISAVAGPEETKNQRGNVLRLIQIRLATHSFEKSCLRVKKIAATATTPDASAAPVTPNAVIRVYDEAGNVIERHEHTGDFKEW
jgi:hypothetical protein